MTWYEKPADRFFSTSEERAIVAAIKEAEALTSGEIRVHLENHCEEPEVEERAWRLFHELEMGETQLRNGVLIYLAVKDHKFAIIADAGINEVVAADFWEHIATGMEQDFRAGEFEKGIISAVKKSGKALSQHFPPNGQNPNELSDELSFGDLWDEA